MFWVSGDSVSPDLVELDEVGIAALKAPQQMWEIVLPDGSSVFLPGEHWYVAFRVPVSPTTYRWVVEYFVQPPEGAPGQSTAAQDGAQALVDGGNTVVVRRYRDYEETTTFTFDGATVPPAEW
ncbi:hypothetical protein GBF35_26005 [Nonomuraea phyllanthi]|uniref:hypothetical protein n=1 Tax=Nonomuraea phyllanthi TaxID=2219224 RepID=UPI0012932D69|nr:hypothetical protein [Nonomuraea phyllanthi]QFY09649.1 hypothetical protein GBF35_26005 [Nonomuraea phyllanthi]